ncbi:MAG: hypothetical protein ABL957_08460 [Parvularculaceae bacterium]
MSGPVTTLYHPVGASELRLIEALQFRAFPPRLPEQPIFYPVLNEEYAIQIARDWNTRFNNDGVGYVTRFAVGAAYLARSERRIVGANMHEELWIPAERLAEFNLMIVGKIEVIHTYTKNDVLSETVG